jgi:hypothetical protein
MPDPIRHKNKTEIWVEAKHHVKEVETPIRFYVTADKDRIEKLSETQVREMLEQDLKNVSPTPVSGIYNTHSRFQYVDPNALKDFDYGNTLIEAHIPYCLHIPNEQEFEIVIPEENITALVTLRKVWTNRASDKGVKSSEVDFYAEDRVLYFQKSTMVGPVMPIRPEEGWEHHYTGTNIEKIKGQDGVFRYTMLYIQFDFEPNISKLETIEGKEVLEEVKSKALLIVNRLIDSYRFTTNLEHIQRLGTLAVNLIYFTQHGFGYHMSSLGFGIETAPMNRSRKEIMAVEKMLEDGEKPDLYNLLLLDAKSSFNNKNFSLAVVQSFQALEIFLENFLLSELKKRGDSDVDAANYLDQNWRTKARLKECMRELRGTCLCDSDRMLWDKWCLLYDQTRNEIIHKGKEPKQAEVEDMLQTNLKVLAWLKSI